VVKLFGISAAGLVAGALLKERAVDKVLAGVVIAGAAHFVNLVDVRPGRAAGAVLALGAPGRLRQGPGAEPAAAAMGAAGAVLSDDLGERAMIGDTGAHALGAALGAAVAAGWGSPAQVEPRVGEGGPGWSLTPPRSWPPRCTATRRVTRRVRCKWSARASLV
jgi:hypothetical protein